MIINPKQHRTMPLGVVLKCAPGVTRWQPVVWTASGVLPGAGPASWHELRRDGETVEFHAATPTLELHGSDTGAYLHELQAQTPSIYVVMRTPDTGDRPLEVVMVTASPYEAQDYADTGEELIEKVPMPQGLIAWICDFVEMFHEEEAFIKRKRDRKRVDLAEDGIGDARIVQTADVYRAPAQARKERLQ